MLTGLALLVRASGHVCALPLHNVFEVMRPLPIDRLAEMPSFLLGISVIRGRPTPVVALIKLFAEGNASVSRFVLLRVEQRTLALAVESICGVYDLRNLQFQDLPPLLRDTHSEMVEAIGTLDAQFLMLLRSACILSEKDWQALAAQESA